VSGLSPTQRTIRALKDQGRVCGIVERFNQHIGPHGVRQDLFGIIDIIALDPERGVVGIQSCGKDFAAHERTILETRQQETYDWLSTPGTSLELWGWRKVKLVRGGVAERWAPRIRVFTLEDIRGETYASEHERGVVAAGVSGGADGWSAFDPGLVPSRREGPRQDAID
jgi:hypothetical protein